MTKDHSKGSLSIEVNWDEFPSDMDQLHEVLLRDPGFAVSAAAPIKSLGSSLSVEACQAMPVAIRFAWISDVQMRQREAKLYGTEVSSTLDHIIQSFKRDEMEEEYDWAVYLSTIAALDKLNVAEETKTRPDFLRFLIHTGDAMDGGFVQELWQFLAITNSSRMPWFNAVGNHDGSVFGNYSSQITYTKEAFSDFFPIAGLQHFLGMHDSREAREGEFVGHLPRPLSMVNDETTTGAITLEARVNGGPERIVLPSTPPSMCHGFDLTANSELPCARQPGYYSFEVEPGVVVVVLASARQATWGQWASWKVDGSSPEEKVEAEAVREQLVWLRELVSSYTGKTILVFSHHRMKEASTELRKILDDAASQNSIAVFTGHTHDDDVTKYDNFYDLNLASIIAFPQASRIIEIRRSESGRKGCLVSRPVYTSYFQDAYALASDHRRRKLMDAELESCATDAARNAIRNQQVSDRYGMCDRPPTAGPPAAYCPDYIKGLAADMKRAVRCGHLGAMRDWINRRGVVPRLETDVTQVVIPLDQPGGE